MRDNYGGGRVPAHGGIDPQLPSYMKSNMGGTARGAYTTPPVRGSNMTYAAARTASAPVARSTAAPSRPVRSGGGSGGSGSGGSRTGSRAPRKKRLTRAQKLMRLAVMAFCTMLVAVGAVFLLQKIDFSPSNTSSLEAFGSDTFASGVMVENVDISGKTVEQARGALVESTNATLASVNITLATESGSWTLGSSDLGISIDTEGALLAAIALDDDDAMNVEAALVADRTAVVNKLNAMADEMSLAPIEPQMIATLGEDNKPIFDLQEGRDGRVLDVEATADSIMASIESNQLQANIEPTYTMLSPTVDQDFLVENTAFRGGYTTEYSISTSDETTINRVFNIHKAGDIMNGMVIQPGEEWSFNTYVGLRTAEDGWKAANGISGGKEYTLQVGGGICQPSTTLYNALLAANIEITDRKAHSIPSSYVEYGLDATVDSSGIDFKFLNDTSAPLYVFVYYTESPNSSRRELIHIDVYGEPLPDGVTYTSSQEILEEIPRDPSVEEPIYTDDPSIPYGYQLTTLEARSRFEAAAYQEMYVDGELVEKVHLYDDTYRGNVAEISIGTGNPYTTPVPEGAVAATRQPSVMPSDYATWGTSSSYIAPPTV